MPEKVKLYPGIHQPNDAQNFERACISMNRIRRRRKPVSCGDVIVDSAAFSELEKYGFYRHEVEEHARDLHRLHSAGVIKIAAAVAQDYMCEPFILAKTGLTIADHQRLTIERYDRLITELDRLSGGKCPFHVMPVIQGFAPQDYVDHIRMYGDRLTPEIWVGVGSVCKRQGNARAILRVLLAIKNERPDLRLHGFGVKITSLMHPGVRELLYSADSMAWSFAARKQGRDANDWREAKAFVDRIDATRGADFKPWQMEFAA